MDDNGSTPIRSEYLDRLRLLIDRGEEFDLRDVLGGATPDDGDVVAGVVREYGRLRRGQGEVADFEEFRRAIPWMFECDSALNAAVEVVLESALILGRDHLAAGRSLVRAHPMAAPAVRRLTERWSDLPSDARRRPAAERPLPSDFGPSGMDGRPRYRLLARIGSGPNGDVFQAIDREACISAPTATVAVKILRPAKDPGEVSERLIAWFEHAGRDVIPGICPVTDAGLAPSGEAFVASPLITAHRPLSRPDVVTRRTVRDSVRTILRASAHLEPLHGLGVSHGWIKPTNFLVSDDGSAWLTDLGLLSMHPEPLDAAGSYSDRAALAFVAPEILSGQRDASPASDVYGLAALLFWLLTGALPNGPHAQAAHSLSMDRVAVPRSYPPPIEPDLARICERALSIDPRDRHRSMTEFGGQLQLWLRRRPVGDATMGKARLKKQMLRIIPAVVIAAPLMAIAAWLGARQAAESWRDQESSLLQQYETLQATSEARIRMADEHARAVERLTNANVATVQSTLDGWLDVIRAQTSQSALPTVLLEIAARLPVMADEPHAVLLPQSAASAQYHADRDTESGTMEAVIWDLLAGFKLHEIGDGRCVTYLLNARSELERMGLGSDPWLQAIDAAVAEYPASAGEASAAQAPQNPGS